MSKYRIHSNPERTERLVLKSSTQKPIVRKIPVESPLKRSNSISPTRQPSGSVKKRKKTSSIQRKNPDVNADRKCRENLLNELHTAKRDGDLLRCLNVHDPEFEVLEFYGDSVLKETVSKFILETRRFMDPHMMTQLRVMCIKNDTLAIVYDVLSMDSLIPKEYLSKLKNMKSKGDIVEAVIGELIENDRAELSKKLIAFVAYIGEEEYFVKMATSRNERRMPLNFVESNFESFDDSEVILDVAKTENKDSMLFFSPGGLKVVSAVIEPDQEQKQLRGKSRSYKFEDSPVPRSNSEAISRRTFESPAPSPSNGRRKVKDFSYFS